MPKSNRKWVRISPFGLIQILHSRYYAVLVLENNKIHWPYWEREEQ